MRGFAGLTVQHGIMACTAAIMWVGSPVVAQTRTFDVPAGPAASSVPALARQAGIQILASGETVRAKRTNAVHGSYAIEEALRLLLKGTGLRANKLSGNDIITINAEGDGETGSQDQLDSGRIEDIIVTARYISESVQETPMAISALTSAQMNAANVDNIGTLGTIVPNLWTVPGDARSAGTPKITMRGVAQGDSSSYAAPPAVAIYTDDVYHATTAGSELDFTDVDHVEVNRGPQSTLSGNASIGGSIKIFTRDPAGDDSGYLSFTGGSRKKLGARGALDLGLSPTLALRVSGSFERQDGFVDRLDFTCQMNKAGTPALAGRFPLAQPDVAGRDCVLGRLGGINHAVGQAKLRWRPNDKLDLMFNFRKRIERDEETPELALAYQPNDNPNPNNVVEIYNKAVREAFGIQLDSRFLPPADRPYSTYATNCRPILPLSGAYPPVNGLYVPSGFCYPQEKTADHLLMSAKLRYAVSDNIRLTAIGAYTDYGNAFTTAGDQSPLGYTVSHFVNRAHQSSGEVRLDGKLFDQQLNWVVGGFLVRVTGYQDSFIGFISQNSFVQDVAKIESQSAFFHLDLNITGKWRISGGARYTDGRVIYHFDHPPLLTVPTPFASPQKRWDWLLSSDYKIANDILVYASAATGSRPPGVVTVINAAEQFLPTAGEELISYEVGVKADLFEHALQTNLSAFYTDYKSLATSVVGVQCLGQPGTVTWFATRDDCLQFPNASFVGWNIPVGVPATVKGVEWEITALPLAGLRVDWSGGYNNYKSGVKTPGAPGYLWPGNHRQPIWNMHANASYNIVTHVGTLIPRIDWTWQSQQDFDTTSSVRAPLPIFIVAPYAIWNVQIAYRSPEKDWSAVLAVTNLADKRYSFLRLNGTLNAQSRAAPPREISLTVRQNF